MIVTRNTTVDITVKCQERPTFWPVFSISQLPEFLLQGLHQENTSNIHKLKAENAKCH
jgi:hypothetical protein